MQPVLKVLLRGDRAAVLAALAIVTGLAWWYVLWVAAGMDMGGMDMEGYRALASGAGLMVPASAPWSALEFGLAFAMWAVMMVAMMLPSAAPMILIHESVARPAAGTGKALAATGWFALGYVVMWVGFALIAAAGQWALDRAALLTPMMETSSAILGGLVLIAAGLFQWVPLKHACLSQCQSPLGFLMRYGGFRRDPLGAVLLGARHGAYCVGCCWALMALLFVGGVMNVLWIAGLSALVLIEKVVPFGRLVSRIAGLGLIGAGGWLALAAT